MLIRCFRGKGGPKKEDYAVSLELHGEINVDESKRLINPLRLFFTLVKKESGPYWPRLLKEKSRVCFIEIHTSISAFA